MNRIALIIAGSGNNKNEEKAIIFHIGKYVKFLSSNAGGAWDKEEMVYYNKPTFEHLNNELNSVKTTYTLIILIGHGAIQDSKHIFQLNEKEIINTGQIYTSSKKHLVILESCRSKIENILTIDLEDKIPKFEKGGIIRAPITRELSKQLFFNSLRNCVENNIVCFACKESETANNFYFTNSLLQTCMNWHLDPGPHLQTIGINDLMTHLNTEVNKLSQNQIGVSQSPTVSGFANFPFCVSKF